MKSLLARAGVASLLGVSLIALFAPSAPQGISARGHAPSAAVVAQARHAFIKAMSAHPRAVTVGKSRWISPGLRHGASSKASSGPVTSLQSVNWSGYADSETSTATVSSVSGSWRIPRVSCLPDPYQNQDAFLAQWVGIDGLTSGTVEQLGTGTQCFEGVTYYYVWYEMYPAGTVEEGTAACINNNVDCPEPGDRVSASVKVTAAPESQDNYTLTLTDHTRPRESFSVSALCATDTCLDASAEWIVERPAVFLPFGAQILPLVDYGRTSFSRGHVVSGGVRSSIGGFHGSVYDLAMIDDTGSYFMSCDGQTGPDGQLLLTSDASACPTVAPGRNGRFFTVWDSSF